MKRALIIPTVTMISLGAAAASGPFQEADTDGDGYISIDEFQVAHSARAEKRFAEMDANNDGLLSSDELSRQHERRNRHPRRRPDPETIVSRLDTDGSGGLTLEEIGQRRIVPDEESFLAADSNGSGELDADELAELMKSHMAQRRQKHR